MFTVYSFSQSVSQSFFNWTPIPMPLCAQPRDRPESDSGNPQSGMKSLDSRQGAILASYKSVQRQWWLPRPQDFWPCSLWASLPPAPAFAEQPGWISSLRKVLAGTRPWAKFQAGRPEGWGASWEEPYDRPSPGSCQTCLSFSTLSPPYQRGLPPPSPSTPSPITLTDTRSVLLLSSRFWGPGPTFALFFLCHGMFRGSPTRAVTLSAPRRSISPCSPSRPPCTPLLPSASLKVSTALWVPGTSTSLQGPQFPHLRNRVRHKLSHSGNLSHDATLWSQMELSSNPRAP